MVRAAWVPLRLSGLFLEGGAATALTPADLPADAPQDAVTASAAEVRAVAEWAVSAFSGTRPAPAAPRVKAELRRQYHVALCYGQSILHTPLQIGERTFQRGLGTHTNSEIALTVPEGSKAFKAFVGLDNNANTREGKGSAVFLVEAAGKELIRTPTLRCGDAPVPVGVRIPEGVSQLILKVDATPDGTGWGHADWADAQVALGDGTVLWLDDMPPAPLLAQPEPPFSFTYDGVPSAERLSGWTRDAEAKETNAAIEHCVHWADRKTRLRVAATVVAYRRYPAGWSFTTTCRRTMAGPWGCPSSGRATTATAPRSLVAPPCHKGNGGHVSRTSSVPPPARDSRDGRRALRGQP